MEHPRVERPVRPVSASSGSAAFGESNYVLRPRSASWIPSLFAPRVLDYDLDTVPPMARERFSFSWRSGIVRREPNGPDLVSIKKAGRTSWFARPSYDVVDLATGTSIGRLVPAGLDWEVLDSAGGTIANVLRQNRGAVIVYSAAVGDREVCRFTWAPHGLSVQSAELDIEFVRDVDVPFDRALAMALAPVLDERTRIQERRRWRAN